MMTENIFLEQSEFITLDPRSRVPESKDAEYLTDIRVTPDILFRRYRILLPPELVKGKTVLDLGSCIAATGAWCLTHGATFYRGVEIHEEFTKNSKSCLEKYYPKGNWSIAQQSIEEYLESSSKHFDILVASGIMYGIGDVVKLLSLIAQTADFLVIESRQNQTILHSPYINKKTKKLIMKDPGFKSYQEKEASIAIGQRGMITPGDKTIRFFGFNPSMGAIKFIMRTLGFECSSKPNDKLRKYLPDQYTPILRFALHFKRNPELRVMKFGLCNALEDPANITEEVDWESL